MEQVDVCVDLGVEVQIVEKSAPQSFFSLERKGYSPHFPHKSQQKINFLYSTVLSLNR